MLKINPDLALDVIEYTFDRLPVAQKLRVVERLQRKTRQQRWQPLIDDIRKRAKKSPISDSEIIAICQDVRASRHAKKH